VPLEAGVAVAAGAAGVAVGSSPPPQAATSDAISITAIMNDSRDRILFIALLDP
jgi:3-deoxy-D-arabino-heptulosonate 7-phosphate (DAHP) synthase